MTSGPLGPIGAVRLFVTDLPAARRFYGETLGLQESWSDGAHAAMHSHLTRVIDALLEGTEAEAVERARRETKALREQYQSGGN